MLPKVLFSYIMLLALHASASHHSAINAKNKSQCIQETYTAEIGVREATGRNDGERVEMYLRSTGLGKGYAWCAAFVSWTLEQCQEKNPKSAWSPSWFPASKLIYHRGNAKLQNINPAAGDVFGIYFPNLKRIAHVGFVNSWGEKYVTTVEGNTNQAGSREGDGVYKKRRLVSQIYKVSRWHN